ncbi:MAG: PEP-CTERM sorting domain-containing protein [Phycisphaerales bacterium]|nr:PEP-CTERM sorting domain-containing protein [Phycisphaerales bacterium]
MKYSTLAITSAALAFSGATAHGANFDFEDQIATSIGGIRTGAWTSLSMTNDGIGLTIYRTSGAAFDIFPNDAFGTDPDDNPPPSWGDNSWDPFWDVGQPDDVIVLNFSSLVTGFSIDVGDFGADDDFITINGFSGLDGTGALVDSAADVLAVSTVNWTGTTMSMTGEFRSITIESGPDFRNSIFLDNIRVTKVPAPSALAMIGLGALTAGRRRR